MSHSKSYSNRRLPRLLLSASLAASIIALPASAVSKKKPRKTATTKKAVTTVPATTAPVTTAAVTSAPATSAPAAAGPLFKIAKSQLGDVMAENRNGLSLYMFEPDKNKPGGSVCNGPCADVWPPLIVKSETDLVAPTGFAGKLTAVKRDDGTLQAAVNGWPVYGWAFDKVTGDLNGQAVTENWWVLDASGNPVRTAPTLRWRTNKIAGVDKTTPVLVDLKGLTLYMFENDKTKNVSNCYDDCAKAWPPVLVNDDKAMVILQGTNVDQSKIQLIRRADTDKFQIAYNGWPLYGWARDTKAGDTTGQKVGNVWWVLGADGNPIRS